MSASGLQSLAFYIVSAYRYTSMQRGVSRWVHGARKDNVGMRKPRCSHEPRNYSSESFDKRSLLYQGMKSTALLIFENQVQVPPTAWLRQLMCDLPILEPLSAITFENTLPMFAAGCY